MFLSHKYMYIAQTSGMTQRIYYSAQMLYTYKIQKLIQKLIYLHYK